ncbi:MAG: cell division protein ZapA [Saccharospirillaceae bacterium]|nr:cell division protein ZapA [Colwellia sp.]NRB77632.1 cell division protein ZapA [Saccharospirillaceae bacterium]
MSAEDSKSISINIMGKQHQFACSAEQAEDLMQAATKLAAMCNDIKQQPGSRSNEQALLVASLNLSYSLMMANNKVDHYQQGHDALLTKLVNAIEC